MTEIYTVVCREGEHEYSWRNVDAFFDRQLADALCSNAQKRHVELRERFPGNVRLGGLNEHDPGYNSYWDVAHYFVETTPVSAEAPKDLAAGKDAVVLERGGPIPGKIDYIRALDVDLHIGNREGLAEPTEWEHEVYSPTTLLRFAYRGLTFTLRLEGGLTQCMSDGKVYEFTAVQMNQLTAEELQQVIAGNDVHRRGKHANEEIRLSYTGVLSVDCDELWFREHLDVAATAESALLDQITRIFEAWLRHNARHIRRENAELDNQLKAFGL
jgi:hypothetical protein